MEKSSEITHLEALIDGQVEILEMITQNKKIEEILEAITLWVEKQADNKLLASILFVDHEGKRLLHGAAPSLPAEYNKAIHGISIGPKVGSCGTAAFTKKPVIVSNIATDPLWADFKNLASCFGLCACWSSPLISKEGKVLGTFAIYYKEPRKPTEEDLRLIHLVNRTTVMALEYKLSEEAKNETEISFQYMAEAIPALIWVSDADAKVTYINKRWERYTGLSKATILQEGWNNIFHPDDLKEMHTKLIASTETGDDYQMYARIKDSAGNYRWHLTLAYPRINQEGKIIQWFGSSVDIHDQKTVVEELEIANQHAAQLTDDLQDALTQMADEKRLLQDMLMNAPAMICILRGPEHRFELVNPLYQNLFPNRELLSHTVREVLPEIESQGFIELLDNVYKTGNKYEGKATPVIIKGSDNIDKEIQIDFLYQPLYKRGKIDGISVFAIDVTEFTKKKTLINA